MKEPTWEPSSCPPFSPSSLCAQPSWWECKGGALGGYEEKASTRKKKQRRW
jgi:hypothetical protein